jgi:hypothetical protein
MNNDIHSGDQPTSHEEALRLAQWLRQLMHYPPPSEAPLTQARDEIQLDLLFDSDYHLRFYQQLPDFIMALLNSDPRATTHYAPLLYHLAGCVECHSGYLDLYDAMRAAIYPHGARPTLGQGTRTLDATPQRMLSHLCRTLISQSEAILQQARRDHLDADASARSLLQLALRISARISQFGLRQQALHDLIRVASLAQGSAPPQEQEDDPDLYSFTPQPVGAAGSRGKKTVRRAAETFRSAEESSVIHLRSRTLEGTITQHEQALELRLTALHESLRGHFVLISVPLGSLLEPVRWLGGNPHAIRSAVAVDADGSLITTLGYTDLRLSDPEEHNLLEALFMLLEVRKDHQEG